MYCIIHVGGMMDRNTMMVNYCLFNIEQKKNLTMKELYLIRSNTAFFNQFLNTVYQVFSASFFSANQNLERYIKFTPIKFSLF